MARTKARWTGKALKMIRREGSKIIIPVKLDNDPDRTVEIGLPLSSVDSFVGAIEKQRPEKGETNGRHAIEEF